MSKKTNLTAVVLVDEFMDSEIEDTVLDPDY